MKISKLARLALSAVLAVPVFAADISGKWKSSMQTPNGQTRESTFNFKVDGDKLTGTLEGPRGSTEISDGKIDGENISFVVVRSFQGNEMKIIYKGKIEGEEIKLKVEVGGREFDQVAKRVK
jgi:hypothetical protein